MNESLGNKYSPPREEGWLRDQEKTAKQPSLRADGEVAHAKRFGVSDLPVRSFKGGFATSFLMSRPPLLSRRGFALFQAVALCLCLLLLSQPAFAADKWISIQTKNFHLVGNASESDIRKAGRTLEEFRSAISMLFPKMEQTSSVPTTIVVFKNDESFKPYKPVYKGQPSNVLAFFQPGEDMNYIALTATLPSPNAILHEYMHFLLRENVGGLPLWIS